MKAKLLYVKDKGDLKNERVVLKALARIDIGRYMICDTTYNEDDTVSNKLRHTFWFPDKVIEEGDFVALYTRAGEDREYSNKADTTTYCFYWGIDRTIWNKEGDAAVLFELGSWSFKNMLAED
jgi:hypothetical protein